MWHETCDEMPSSLLLKLIAICKNIKEWRHDSQITDTDAAHRLNTDTPGLSAVNFSENLDNIVSYFQQQYLAEGQHIPNISEKYEVYSYIKNNDTDPSGKSSLTKADSHQGAQLWYTGDDYNQEDINFEDYNGEYFVCYEDTEHFNLTTEPPPVIATTEATFIMNVHKEIKSLVCSRLI